jgi:L-ascorbate metabolism protein UlaG (beta-lactamase superfamily)
MMVALRWLGAGGFTFRVGKRMLAVDPYLTRIPFIRTWIGRVRPDESLAALALPWCDCILVTHSHFDHLFDVPAIAKRTGAVVAGSPNTCGLLALLGVPARQIREVRAGDRLSVSGFDIEVMPAAHPRLPGFGLGPLPEKLAPPLRAREYRMDVCLSYRVRAGTISMLTETGGECVEGARADILLASPRHPRAALARLLRQVRPRLVVPCHWENIWRPLSRPVRPMLSAPTLAFPPSRLMNPARFALAVQSTGIGAKVFIPEILRENDIRAML